MSRFEEMTQSYPDAALNIALDTIERKKQALIFCSTKRGAESQAEKIAQKTKPDDDRRALRERLADSILAAVQQPTKQCQRLALCVRKGVAFHHSGLASKQREVIETGFRDGTIAVICATPTLAMGMDLPAYRSVIRDLKRYSKGTSWGMVEIPVLEYEQMAGRAGRPGMEAVGEAICIAETESEKDHIVEKYLLGDPEDIYSKLAVEPVLRTYVLSLIASGYVHDTEALHKFFDDTFYAWQYGDTDKLHHILDKMARLLSQWGFIETPGADGRQDDFVAASDLASGVLRATSVGERVAQLYLDPYTAHHLILSLENGARRKLALDEFPLLHLLCTTLEIRPLLSVRQSEIDDIDRLLLAQEDALFVKSPSIYSAEYEDFLSTVKTAAALQAWVNEAGEDVLLEQYRLSPGDLQAKREIADWLLYSLVELAKLLRWHHLIAELEKMRMRLEYGAKEELLGLLRLRGIGRVRARKLVRAGIRSLEDLKRTDGARLKLLLGEKIAIDIKSQVGQEISPGQLRVASNKRKGQINLGDFGPTDGERGKGK